LKGELEEEYALGLWVGMVLGCLLAGFLAGLAVIFFR